MLYYTHYARIENGVVVEYPTNPRGVLLTGEFNIPPDWLGGELDGKTYVYCHDKKPFWNHTEVLVETQPYFDEESGLWYRGYEKAPAPPELIEDRRQVAIETAQSNIAFLLDMYSETRADELELSDGQKESWQTFRGLVATVPDQPGYPFQIDWPEIPDQQKSGFTLEVVRV